MQRYTVRSAQSAAYIALVSLGYALVFSFGVSRHDRMFAFLAVAIVVFAGPIGFLVRMPFDEAAFVLGHILLTFLFCALLLRCKRSWAWHLWIHGWCLGGFLHFIYFFSRYAFTGVFPLLDLT